MKARKKTKRQDYISLVPGIETAEHILSVPEYERRLEENGSRYVQLLRPA